MKHRHQRSDADVVIEAGRSDGRLPEDWQEGGFGLYIHWPFCESKCPYCDFNSHVSRAVDQDRWEVAYLGEIDRIGKIIPGRVLSSVFFGGGTPSLMAPESVGRILEKIARTWVCANDLEVTLEANPSSVEAQRFEAFRDAGVNRVSIGLQALDDASLRRLGRLHSAMDGKRAYDIARHTFSRVSFDLIYGRQDQTANDWRRELAEALAMQPSHLSLYQLTIEDGTAFGDRYRLGKLAGLPDEDLAVELYEVTQELSVQAGMPAYEVSNHAAEAEECRHNLVYWRYGDYAGIGPGAHGRLTVDGRRRAEVALRNPNTWLLQVEKEGHGSLPSVFLTGAEQAAEYLMMSLRLSEGSDLDRYERLAGHAVSSTAISDLVESGHLQRAGHRIVCTGRGRLLLNQVIAALI